LETEPDFEVVLESGSGAEAARLVQQSSATLVLMDVIMPGINGYEATRSLAQQCRTPVVMVTAALDVTDRAVILEALGAGALFVTSPPNPIDSLQVASFLQLLRAMANAQSSHWVAEPTELHPNKATPGDGLDVIGFAASAGGPQLVARILAQLPQRSMPPIALVQHLAPGFSEGFARWLTSASGHPTRVVTGRTVARRGTIYTAKSDHHILWKKGTIELSDGPEDVGFRPSANVLFRSLGACGKRAAAVVLTGMGTDGTQGALEMRNRGGHVVVQSLDTAPVRGMPGAAIAAGAAAAVLDDSEIAAHLIDRSRMV
jgi:two-component system chemotaxis response regulator CheB